MNCYSWRLCAATVMCLGLPARGSTHYVDPNSSHPTAPFTTWVTAAVAIQDAIDAADPEDEIVVTNGVYRTGGRSVNGSLVSRIVVDRAVTVRSVSGPAGTIIEGQTPETGPGDGAIRCAYLANGSVLSGFTLTNGATRDTSDASSERRGGGVWCESAAALVTNCVLIGNIASDSGGAAYSGTLDSCVLDGNTAGYGGATRDSYLRDCSLIRNKALASGGGAFSCILNHCVLQYNVASTGGGASLGTLTNCTFQTNSADYGGGANSAILDHCALTGNWSTNDGGAAYKGTLVFCTIVGNSANATGGGTSGAFLNNCILTRNRAVLGGGAAGGGMFNCTVVNNFAEFGGGVDGGTLYNSIIYSNNASRVGTNYLASTMNYCCIWPQNSAEGNFSSPPLFLSPAADDLRLQSNSPCINAGLSAYFHPSTDLDGKPRVAGGTIDVGAYELQAPSSTISYFWLQYYHFSMDGSADHADPDGDGMDNWSEWRCRTDPTNKLSALRLISAAPDGTNVLVTWQSVPGMRYFVERATNPAAVPFFRPRITNLLSGAYTATYTDPRAAGISPLFYRVGVSGE
jgi:hypothetical protein